MFRKPSIQSVIDDQIYEVQRALIDQAAKVAQAESQMAMAEAHQRYLEARLATLRIQREELAPSPADITPKAPLWVREEHKRATLADLNPDRDRGLNVMHPCGA